MESTTTPPQTIAHTEALAALNTADRLEAHLADLYDNADTPRNARMIGEAHRLIGSAFKRAEIQASLAVAEELHALRVDLNAEPESAYRGIGSVLLHPSARWEDS